MKDYKIKTIVILLLCLSFVNAQQKSHTQNPKSKNSIEFQTTLKKWQEKLKQFNTPESKKTQEFIKLRREMQKELRDIKHRKKTTESIPMMPMQKETKAEASDFNKPIGGNEIKQTSQNATSQQVIAIPDSLFSKKSIVLDSRFRGNDIPLLRDGVLDPRKNKTFPLADKGSNANPSIQSAQPLVTENAEKVITSSVCYDVPFSSKDNVIELSVANSSSQATEGVMVDVTNVPEWLKFEQKQITIPALKSKEEQTAPFIFSVGKSAQVNKEQTLSFKVTAKNGQVWTKEIKINIAPPATYELFQNYPNPFNPMTVISYQLSAVSKISLKVYDILGREVTNLVNEQQEPGIHQTNFDAHRYASGMYIYQLIATDEQKNPHVFRKKMVLLR